MEKSSSSRGSRKGLGWLLAADEIGIEKILEAMVAAHNLGSRGTFCHNKSTVSIPHVLL